MKISVIIPNYNGEKILSKNLPKVIDSIKNLNYEKEIVITDDNSTDLSLKIIEKFIDDNEKSETKIKLIKNSINRGFSSNVNKGVEASRGDILVLLNTDVVPYIDFLNPILPHFKDEKIFAVGCLDESVEGERIILRGRGKGKWKKGFMVHSAAEIESGDTLWVSGGSGVFRRGIWEKLNGLDVLYNPFYWEDIDLSYRARKSGYKTIFEKKSIVKHDHEKGTIKTEFQEKEVKKIVYKNQFLFVWKNVDLKMLIIHIIWLPYNLIFALFKDRLMLMGFFKALLILPKIIKKRNVVQKHFILDDFEATRLIK